MTEPIITIKSQGAPMVNADTACILREGPGFAAILVDLHSKHCETGASISGCGEPPELAIESYEHSIHLDETKDPEEYTIVSFPRWPGWMILCADIARYTLSVCLVDSYEAKEQGQ